MRSGCALKSSCCCSLLSTAQNRQIWSFALCATCRAYELASPVPCCLVHIWFSTFVPKSELSSCKDCSTWSVFSSSKERAFLLLGRCPEKWSDGFVIVCNWCSDCSSYKDIYLVYNSIWSKSNLSYLKFPTASIVIYLSSESCMV